MMLFASYGDGGLLGLIWLALIFVSHFWDCPVVNQPLASHWHHRLLKHLLESVANTESSGVFCICVGETSLVGRWCGPQGICMIRPSPLPSPDDDWCWGLPASPVVHHNFLGLVDAKLQMVISAPQDKMLKEKSEVKSVKWNGGRTVWRVTPELLLFVTYWRWPERQSRIQTMSGFSCLTVSLVRRFGYMVSKALQKSEDCDSVSQLRSTFSFKLQDSLIFSISTELSLILTS